MSFHKELESEQTESNPSKFIPTTINDIDEEGYAVLNEHPCKITDIRVTGIGSFRRGKITGVSLWTNKEQSQFFDAGEKVHVPIIKRTEYQLVDIDDDDFLVLMDENGAIREDMRLLKDEGQSELSERIKKSFEADKSLVVSVLAACGEERIVDFRESN